MFTEKDIVKNVSSQSTIDRGVRLFKNDYVWDINTNETKKGLLMVLFRAAMIMNIMSKSVLMNRTVKL